MFGFDAVLKMIKWYLLEMIIGKSDFRMLGKFPGKYGGLMMVYEFQKVIL